MNELSAKTYSDFFPHFEFKGDETLKALNELFLSTSQTADLQPV
jgi:hypothetical protein